MLKLLIERDHAQRNDLLAWRVHCILGLLVRRSRVSSVFPVIMGSKHKEGIALLYGVEYFTVDIFS